MSWNSQPPETEQPGNNRTPWALVLAVIALGATVLVGLGLISKQGTKADNKNMWKQ